MANRSWILDAPYRQLGDRVVGAGRPVYITGEIGINHNGDLDNADAANPREINKNGHVIEITERNNRAGTTSFSWDLFLVCGDADQAGTYFGGWKGPVAPISCPDNLAFDSAGNLWIATDGAPGSISKADGLFRVPLEGDERGHLVQFLAVPYQAEACGPVIHDRDGSVFISVQHPGEEGSWDEQLSYFPDHVPAGAEPPELGVAHDRASFR